MKKNEGRVSASQPHTFLGDRFIGSLLLPSEVSLLHGLLCVFLSRWDAYLQGRQVQVYSIAVHLALS